MKENAMNPTVNEIEQNVHHIVFDDNKELFLIGTAHVSQSSVDLVERIINEKEPDVIAVELDQKRYDAIQKKSSYEDMDIIQIIKKKQLLFLIGQFLLSSFQKKISEKTGTNPGDEFRKAADIAKEKEIRLVLADRELGTTLKRAWGLTPFFDKVKLMFSLLVAEDDEIESTDIEELKKSNAIDEMVKMFAKQLPATKEVLIDERDSFLSYQIVNNLGEKTVAVVGAGHVQGILDRFQNPVSHDEKKKIDVIPPPSLISKILPWIIPVIIIAVFTLGFMFGRKEVAQDVLVFWVLANGALSALGCIIAFGHPLTAIAGFIAAPLTSLNPTIGAGFVTAFVQTLLVKPRVRDFEQIQEGTLKFFQWWQNRLTRIFLVFILSSIGSSIGTFVAAPYLAKFFNG
jgi:pheromone shutdown-related protein TraB